MASFSTGLSGLSAAQAALDVIGNNVANAGTEGYHRQRIELAPATCGQTGNGVDVVGVTRMIDTLLESEIARQEAEYGQVSQELSLLSTVETTLGEFAAGSGLNATIDAFFDSLRRLAANPLERVLRNEVISAAQVLANDLRRFGSSLESLEDQVVQEAGNTLDSINTLTSQIAELNGKIQTTEIGQGQANNLRDQRDRLITGLTRLIGVETVPRDNGIVDVSIGGVPVVTGSIILPLTVGLQEDGMLAVSPGGAQGDLAVEGGRMGALLALKNELLAGVQADLDTLARTIAEEVNRNHVQGLGLTGSFRELSGCAIGAANVAAMGAGVTDGTFQVRVTDTATGAVQRHAVNVQVSGAAPDTPASIAAALDAINGLNASITAGRLYIVADPGYTFDFLPALLPEPTQQTFTAASPPTVAVSGLFNGGENDVLTFTATGNGSVANGTLQLAVTDSQGDVVGMVNVGAGYAAGDVITLNNGLRIAVSTGDLNAGDRFEVEAFATTDTSGFLAAAGMNTFFSGARASDIRVNNELFDTPDRLATALDASLTDNACVLRLAALRETALASLAGMTPGEYYQRTVTGVAQEVALRQARQENVGAMLQSLQQQRGSLSDVNINDEAAQLLIFQQMFQAAAKYLSSLQMSMTTLMEMVGRS
ncbi:MAG: flagellar hook-associated protein FlgK [Planctomycetes bacterium]|nr:flagellar hook-associated protein FlgK [Planctomycetota bacterium]